MTDLTPERINGARHFLTTGRMSSMALSHAEQLSLLNEVERLRQIPSLCSECADVPDDELSLCPVCGTPHED